MCVPAKSLQSCLTPCPLWTAARQAPLSMGFSREEFWAPGDLPDPGLKPMSPASPALAGRFFTAEPPGKPQIGHTWVFNNVLQMGLILYTFASIFYN